jgi:hypothetical protein
MVIDPSYNKHPERTVFKDREKAPRRLVRPSLASTLPVKSVRTGAISNTVNFATGGPELTKAELRAMLTQAVLNTK